MSPVSLRKCLDCGQDVSSAAAVCPHCGRPNRRSTSPIELSGVLIIAVVCAGALLWRLSSRYAGSSETAPAVAPETTVAQPSRPNEGLGATVGYNRRLFMFRVQNGDPYPWTNCQLSLNAQGISSGYIREVAAIRPGLTNAALLESVDFVDGDGRKFEPATQQVATLDISCETPKGHRSYGGKF
jgi:hypothetical protein